MVKKRYHNYRVSFKLIVIDYAEKHSIHAASKKFGPGRKVIRLWKSNKQKFILESSKTLKSRLSKPVYSKNIEMEIELSAWIKNKRIEGICVSKSMIRQQALRIKALENYDENDRFKAYDGWFVRFY